MSLRLHQSSAWRLGHRPWRRVRQRCNFGRNATSNGMATRSPSSPRGSRASRRGSRSRTGSSPRSWRSGATTPTASASGTSRPGRSATSPRTRAGGRWAGASSGSTGRLGDELVIAPDLVEDNHQIDTPGRPEDGYHLADDLSETRCRTSRSWARPVSNNHYNTGWAWALDTPFPYWKRWAGYEGGVADMCLVSWPAAGSRRRRRSATSTPTPSTWCRPSTTCSTSHRPTSSRASCRARSKARASPLRSRTRRYPASRRSSTRCWASVDLPRRLAGGVRCTRRSGWATSTRTSGSCSISTLIGHSRRTSPPGSPSVSSR